VEASLDIKKDQVDPNNTNVIVKISTSCRLMSEVEVNFQDKGEDYTIFDKMAVNPFFV
jgi:hypothetical protein